MSIVRRYPLICFYVLACGITWGIIYPGLALPGGLRSILFKTWVPAGLSTAPLSLYGVLSNYGPSVAGLAVTGACLGRLGVREWLSRWVRWRVPWTWYVVALSCGPMLFLFQNLITRPKELLALPVHSTGIVLGDLVTFLPLLIPYLILNAGEEGGWRGFALPRLQERYGPLWGSCILGVAWEAWHLQAILQPGNPYYALGASAVSLHLIRGILIWILYAMMGTWIFNNTHGSLLPVTLWHASINLTNDMEARLFHAAGGSLPGHALGDWILWPIVAIIMIWLTHGRLGYDQYLEQTRLERTKDNNQRIVQ